MSSSFWKKHHSCSGLHMRVAKVAHLVPFRSIAREIWCARSNGLHTGHKLHNTQHTGRDSCNALRVLEGRCTEGIAHRTQPPAGGGLWGFFGSGCSTILYHNERNESPAVSLCRAALSLFLLQMFREHNVPLHRTNLFKRP